MVLFSFVLAEVLLDTEFINLFIYLKSMLDTLDHNSLT